MFDSKCLHLAEHFAPELTPETQAELAELIQETVEAFLQNSPDARWAKPAGGAEPLASS